MREDALHFARALEAQAVEVHAASAEEDADDGVRVDGGGPGGIAEVVVDVAAHHRGVRGPGLDVAEQTHEVVHVSNHPEGLAEEVLQVDAAVGIAVGEGEEILVVDVHDDVVGKRGGAVRAREGVQAGLERAERRLAETIRRRRLLHQQARERVTIARAENPGAVASRRARPSSSTSSSSGW